LLERLNGVATTLDTPRGLVVTLPDSAFNGSALRADRAGEIARVAQVLAAQPGLRITVEGHSDSTASAPTASERAASVRSGLVAASLPASTVQARDLGDSRPVVSNASEGGRVQNRRVEIVVTGDSIGNLPTWNRPYSLSLK
jgi:outer membrane protein OmpA-like peptidoglycan-associated protein